jgi:hypothetical protein
MVRYVYFLDYDPEDQIDVDGFEQYDASASAFVTPTDSVELKETLTLGKTAAPQPASKPRRALELHADVYVLADRYDVAALKYLALEKFKRALRSHWDDDAFVAAAHTAYECGLRRLM